MSNIDDVQLRRLDLTLLLVFDATLRTRKLTLVALELGLTQSAISHALGRLRDIFGDPLFIRRHTGVEPTPRALALAGPVGQSLATLREALGQGRWFDPATATRTFRIAMLDYGVALFGPGFVGRLAQEAPGLRMAFVSLTRTESMARLADGAVDLALGVFPAVPAGYRVTILSEQDFVVALRVGHPALADVEQGGALGLDTFCGLPQMIVSAGADFTGSLDQDLAALGRSRRVVAAIPQFLAAMATAARSDVIISLPRALAVAYAPAFGLALRELPLPSPRFQIMLMRHVLTASDSGIDWLQAEIEAASSGYPEPAAPR